MVKRRHFLLLILLAGLAVTLQLGQTWAETNDSPSARRSASCSIGRIVATPPKPGTVFAKSGASLQVSGALSIWVSNSYDSVIWELVENFEEAYPEVDVSVDVISSSNYHEQLQTAFMAGSGPDLFIAPHTWLNGMYEYGLIQELDDYVYGYSLDWSNFTVSAKKACNCGEQIAGIPIAMFSYGFFVNPDLFDMAAVDYPDASWSWDDVRASSEEIQSELGDVYGFVIPVGSSYHFRPIQTAYDGYIFDNETNDVGVSESETIDALDWLVGMTNDGVMPLVGSGDPEAMFESGQAAMILSGSWNLNRYRTNSIPYDIIDFPGNGRSFVSVDAFFISAAASNPDAAFAFINQDLYGTMQLISDYLMSPSPYLPVLSDSGDSDLETLGYSFADATPALPIELANNIYPILDDAIQSAMYGNQTSADALEGAAELISESLDE